MPFKAKKLTPIDTSSLSKLGQGVVNLSKYTEDEFGQVAKAFQATEPMPISYAAPPKPRAGTIVYADGVHWNPGNGEGVYVFGLDGVWHSVGGGFGAWSTYTPTVVATSGTFTTVSAAGRFRITGKSAFLTVQISITAVGTAAGTIVASLPLAAASVAILAGRENAVVGKMLQGEVSGTGLYIINYDNTFAGGNGYVLYVSGVYEIA